MQNQENLRENLFDDANDNFRFFDEEDFIPWLEPRELFYTDKHLIE